MSQARATPLALLWMLGGCTAATPGSGPERAPADTAGASATDGSPTDGGDATDGVTDATDGATDATDATDGTDTGEPGGGGPPAPPAGALVLDGVRTVDAALVREGAAVILFDGRIWDVREAGGPWPDDVTVQELPGRTVIPGLIDSHVHLFHSGALDYVGPTLTDNLAALVAWGVTGAADLGAPEAAFALRDELEAGQRLGPRLWVTGPMLTTPGSHPCEVAYDAHLCLFIDDDPAGIAGGLADADGLKVALADAAFTPWPTPRVDLDDLISVIDAGTAQGQPVVAHVDTPDDAWDAWDAGVTVMAHPVFSAATTDLPPAPVTSTLAAFDGPPAAEDGRLLSEDLSWTPPAVRDNWRIWDGQLDLWLSDWAALSADWRDAAAANLQTLHARGDLVLPGTDSGYWLVPHGVSLHRELARLVELGWTEREALSAATLYAAQTWGWTDQGLVEPGLRASLVVLSANPLDDIANTRAIEMVLIDGVVAAATDALLPGAGTMCASDDDCGLAESCDALAHRCVASCSVAFAAQNSCGPDAACLPGDALPGGSPACRALRTCDPYAQDCAPTRYGEACVPLDLDTSACLPAGIADVGEGCGWTTPADGCRPGLFCSFITSTCFELCDPDAADTCSAGTCQRQRAAGQPWFGLCL